MAYLGVKIPNKLDKRLRGMARRTHLDLTEITILSLERALDSLDASGMIAEQIAYRQKQAEENEKRVRKPRAAA
jgi:hypothetical protein